ncbi:MAG: hypothetical protein HY532_00490 [Chloroflexi bacterium]|nr:hypothetical protein [Chloroflexota bacterium]
MTNSPEYLHILDLCLDRVLRQEEAVEACLQDYPEYAEELGAVLRLAVASQKAALYTPSPSTKAAARAVLHRAIQEREARLRLRGPWYTLRAYMTRMMASRGVAMAAATAAVFMVMASTGAVAASSNSEPGEVLYPIKRTVERARLVVARDPQTKAQLYMAFADRRLEEIAGVASRGDVRRAEGLRREAQANLYFVRVIALPGQVTIVAMPGPPPGYHEGLRPSFTPPAGWREQELRVLQDTVEAHLQMMEFRSQVILQRAPEPVRADIRRQMQQARQDYEDLLLAFQQAYEYSEGHR